MNASPQPWDEVREQLCRDRRRVRAMLLTQYGRAGWIWLHPSYQAVFLHRLAHYCWRRGMGKLARYTAQLNLVLTGMDAHPHCALGGGLLIPFTTGVGFSGSAGRDLTMLALSGIGMMPVDLDVGAGPGLPIVGDGVTIGPAGGVLGPVRTGDGGAIDAGVVSFNDIETRTIVGRVSGHQPAGAAPATTRVAPSAHRCPHASLRAGWRDFREDVRAYLDELERHRAARRGLLRVLGALTTNHLLATAIYRVSHALHARRWRRCAAVVAALNVLIHKCSINPASCIGGRLFMPHPPGTAVNCVAGAGLTLYAHSVATSDGPMMFAPVEQGPELGDRITVGALSGFVGAITVGGGAATGSKGVVYENVPADAVVASAALRVRRRPRGPEVTDRFPGDARAMPGGAAAAGLPGPPPPAISAAQTRERLRADRRRLIATYREAGARNPGAASFFPAYVCAWLYRWSHYHFTRGAMGRARFLWQLNLLLTGSDLAPWAEIGPGLVLPHPAGVCVRGRVGSNLTMLAMTGISPGLAEVLVGLGDPRGPEVGDDVFLGHFAAIHGAVKVGRGARLLAGALVTQDVPDGAVLAAPRLRAGRTGRHNHDSAEVKA